MAVRPPFLRKGLVSDPEICLLIETLRIDGRRLRFERAVLFGGEDLLADQWRLMVFDADPAVIDAAGEEVRIVATMAPDYTVAGRARKVCVTPACGYVRLQGIGMLLRC